MEFANLTDRLTVMGALMSLNAGFEVVVLDSTGKIDLADIGLSKLNSIVYES